MQTITPPANEDVLDLEQIGRLRALRNGALLPVLLKAYREQTGTQLKQITAALAASDCHTVREVTHALKSASFSLGAKQMGTLCAAMEAAAREADLDQCSALHIQLLAAHDVLMPLVAGLEPS